MIPSAPESRRPSRPATASGALAAFLAAYEKAHPALASLLGSIDIFSAWSIALLAIGFSVISRQKLTVKSAALGVMIPWLIWVLGKAGFAALFS